MKPEFRVFRDVTAKVDKEISKCPVCQSTNIEQEFKRICFDKYGEDVYYEDLGCSYCIDCGTRFKYPKAQVAQE